MKPWTAGATIVLRWVKSTGIIWGGYPVAVVNDSDDLLALYFPVGTVYRSLPPPPREGEAARAVAACMTSLPAKLDYQDHTWERNHILRLMFPARSYSIWLAWEERSWEFAWYYVNLEAPYIRTPLGVDTQDHVLDIVVRLDRTWYYKDDDQLQSWVDAGLVATEASKAVRAEARHVASTIDRWGSHHSPTAGSPGVRTRPGRSRRFQTGGKNT